jgi:transcriptional regulator with XRE-family HTH domain
MPRLAAPDPLSEAIGRRVRGLRTALGLTQERLAFESGSIAKGHLSDLEKGLLRPTVHTLKGVADRLGVRLMDLVSDPNDGPREALLDLTRALPDADLSALFGDARARLARATAHELAEIAPGLRRVRPSARDRFTRCVPLVGLDLAAGGFTAGESDPSLTWVAPASRRRLRPGMFVARVVGQSMEPKIPDGAYCLFASPVSGDLQGRVLLVQHRGIHDADTGTSYTVKRFERRGAEGDGVVRLVPENPRYAAITLDPRDAHDLRIVAELLEVLATVAPGVPPRR